MKHFIMRRARGEDPSPAHFHPEVLADLEGLYVSLLPQLAQQNLFIYLSATAEGEGASTISWALAYYLAMREGKDCLFVDGDLSDPFIKSGVEMPAAGLSDYLQGNEDFRALPFPTELRHLAAIHSGRIRSQYVRLAAERAAAFASEARRYYRATIFNSRPGFDRYAELWGRNSDAVILTTQYRGTKREVLNRILSGFELAGIRVSGLIFNKREYPIPDAFYKRL